MSVNTNIRFCEIDSLYLDPMNPRLGRHQRSRDTKQDTLLEWLLRWKLDELASSFLANRGFWSYEPLIATVEPIYNKQSVLVVIAGNRRLAALKCLRNCIAGNPPSRKWSELLEGVAVPRQLFTHVPYLVADSREDVHAFLGYRKVTGIKQWDADEKAGFIAQLVVDYGLSYEQVAKKVGITAPAVRRHYVAFQLMLQMESTIKEFPIEVAEHQFAILYEAIQKAGVQDYLGLNVTADAKPAKFPIKKRRLPRLAHFARWLYGTKKLAPLITDARQISEFGKILENKRATEYLESADQPTFQVAHRLARGDEPELVCLLSSACDQMEEALRTIHRFKNSRDIQKIVRRLGTDVFQLLENVPAVGKSSELTVL